jgi:hypothetical protein
MRKANNRVSPATVVSELADMAELSYHEIRALHRHQYLTSGNDKCTYTVTIDIHLQEG